MSWPVPCGMVQAPPKAVTGAPAINASAAAAAHQRLGPARVKTMPPNANYAVLQGLWIMANINRLRARTAQMGTLSPEADWFRLPHLFAPSKPGAPQPMRPSSRSAPGQAIAAFASLAERLEDLAARRPWWRRLVG
jgi:hypothetical protein